MLSLLVTGSSGFVGGILQRELASVPFDVDGQPVELRDADSVERALREIQPSSVIHLAAQTWVPRSFQDPRETYDINFSGTLNLLLGLKATDFRGKVLFVSSSDVYGLIDAKDLPVAEEQLPKPRSPYAVSKVAGESLCFQWSQTERMEILIARPFVHIGPGQDDRFVISNFAKQIVEIKKKLRSPIIHVGDLKVTRDFTDVRDVTRAYHLLLQYGVSSETYNVCSGIERSIESLLYDLLAMSGVVAEIRQDPARLRSSEQRRVVGSFKKVGQQTGWKPEIPLHQTLQSILDYWEGKV